MKTNEQIKEELIEYYKNRVHELEGQLAKLTENYHKLERSFRVNPGDKWYLEYLKQANASIAFECDARQRIIEQYQQHYAKWGTFYTDWEKSHKYPQGETKT